MVISKPVTKYTRFRCLSTQEIRRGTWYLHRVLEKSRPKRHAFFASRWIEVEPHRVSVNEIFRKAYNIGTRFPSSLN
jgi:hypothetical protein